jgi:hypothetical protein
VAKKSSLPKNLPRAAKRTAGSTAAAKTPLNLRTSGVRIDPTLEGYVRDRAGRKLGNYALNVERVSVRFEDVNGPKQGIDIVCRIKVVLSGIASAVVEERAATPREAFNRAIDRTQRAVKRDLARAGRRSPRARQPARASGRAAPAPRAKPSPKDGSLIGRRVGRADENLRRAAARPEKLRRDVPIDTAAAGQSATARRAGGGSTAARNTKRPAAGATSALEDSAQDRPSRKSTRRSKHRSKRDSNLRRRETRAVRAPSARAARAAARSKG